MSNIVNFPNQKKPEFPKSTLVLDSGCSYRDKKFADRPPMEPNKSGFPRSTYAIDDGGFNGIALMPIAAVIILVILMVVTSSN